MFCCCCFFVFFFFKYLFSFGSNISMCERECVWAIWAWCCPPYKTHSHIKVFLSLMQMYFCTFCTCAPFYYVLFLVCCSLLFSLSLSLPLSLYLPVDVFFFFLWFILIWLLLTYASYIFVGRSFIRSFGLLVHLVPSSLALLTWCFTCDHFLPKSLTFMCVSSRIHTRTHSLVCERASECSTFIFKFNAHMRDGKCVRA